MSCNHVYMMSVEWDEGELMFVVLNSLILPSWSRCWLSLKVLTFDDYANDDELMIIWWKFDDKHDVVIVLIVMMTCWLYGCKYLIMQLLVNNINMRVEIQVEHYVIVCEVESCIVKSLLEVHVFIVMRAGLKYVKCGLIHSFCRTKIRGLNMSVDSLMVKLSLESNGTTCI